MTTSIASLFNGKHAVIAVLLTFVPMLPALVLEPLGYGDGIGPFLMAAIACLMATVFSGPRLGFTVAGSLAVAEMLVLPAAPYPVWAGLLMAAAALLYGISSRRGISSMIVTAPIAIAFALADPPNMKQGSMWADALAVGIFVLLGGLWGIGFGAFLGRKMPRKVPPVKPVRMAVVFATTIALVTGVTMAIVVATGIGHTGAWILLTILLVVQPGMGATFQKSVERAIGTALGFGIALVVALLVSNKAALIVLAMLFLTLAVYTKLDTRSKYWQFTTFLTPGIVLAEGAGSDVVATDINRLWASLLGVAIALAVLAVFRLLGVQDKEEEHAGA